MRGDAHGHGVLSRLRVHESAVAVGRATSRADPLDGTDVRRRPRSRLDLVRSGATHGGGPAGRQRPAARPSGVLGGLQGRSVEPAAR